MNLDESGITNVAVCPKVLAPTGRKQVGQITAQERGTLVTAIGFIADDGNAIPPVLIFPRRRVSAARLGHGSPPGTIALNSPNGWMTKEIFAKDVLPYIVTCTDEDISVILSSDIIHHLPAPSRGTAQRTQGIVSFDVDLSNLTLQ